MSRLRLHRLRTLLCGLLPALLLAGCGEEPTPPRLIGFNPPVLAVPASETLEITVAYEDDGDQLGDFRWRAEAGEIEGNGTPTITYRAPEQPGDYALAVTAAYGDEGDELTLDAVVQVTPAIATEPPAIAEASGAQPAPTEATEGAPGQAAGAGEERMPAAGSVTTGAPEQATAAGTPTRRSSERDRRSSRSRPPRRRGHRRRPKRRPDRRRARASRKQASPRHRTRRLPGRSWLH